VFAQQVDAKLFARLGEAKHAVESDDIGEYPATLVVMNQFEEAQNRRAGTLKLAEFGFAVVFVYARVLVMKRCIEKPAADTGAVKHPRDKWLELDIAVV
jgi:hypothetical protein